jgi:predicted ATPase/DNA-binding XRE family transcriptional regulator
MEFTTWLKERRKTLDLTQADLAERVGCSLVTIYKIESGERRPSKQIAERLADCLSIGEERRGSFIQLARGVTPEPETDAAPASPAPRLFQGRPPYPPTRLIGRDAELARIAAYLEARSRRVITLLGPGGVGKTRLAQEICQRFGRLFRDGAGWIALADIHDPVLVAPAIAQTLGLREQAGQPLAELIAAALAERECLIVLDNFEQVAGAAPFVGALLALCPGLTVVATSRVPLHLRGEQQFPVPPLGAPAAGDPADLAADQAVALFVERTQAIRPQFVLTAENAGLISAICQRLDGLPLAIELVAVQTKYLSLQAILDRFRTGALPLLASGALDLEPRHQTLRRAFDWSYSLLPAALGGLFSTLGVFSGWWTAADVAAVSGSDDRPDIEHALNHLVEINLVQISWDDDAPATRYALLETIREYATEQLVEQGRHAATCRRHAEHFCALAEAAEPLLRGAGQQEALKQLHQNEANLRVALQWSIGADPALAERLGAALWRFWWLRGEMTAGWSWVQQLLALPVGSPRLRAILFNAAGSINLELGNLPQVREYHTRALELRREIGDELGIASSLGNLGNLARQQGDPQAALALFSESLEHFLSIGNEWGTATTLLNLGTVAEDLSDLAGACDYYQRSLDSYRAIGDTHGAALALGNLGGVALLQGDAATGARLYREALAIAAEITSHVGIVHYLEALARALAMQDQADLGARLCGAAAAVRATYEIKVKPIYQPQYEETLAMLRRKLDPAAFEAAWTQGRALPIASVISLAIQPG